MFLCLDSPTVTTINPRYSEQQSQSSCCDESKNLDVAFYRDYKQLKHDHHSSQYYREENIIEIGFLQAMKDTQVVAAIITKRITTQIERSMITHLD